MKILRSNMLPYSSVIIWLLISFQANYG